MTASALRSSVADSVVLDVCKARSISSGEPLGFLLMPRSKGVSYVDRGHAFGGGRFVLWTGARQITKLE